MKRIIWFFFFASVPGILGQIDMNGKAFGFYEKRTNYVELIPAKSHITEFTICVKSCRNLTENMLEVALHNNDGNAEFLVSFTRDPNKNNGANLFIFHKNEFKDFNFPVSKMWINVCTTFDFGSGKLVVFLNGKAYGSSQLGSTKNVVHAARIIIGQTNYGQPNTNVAQITNVNIWSSALTARDIQRFLKKNRGGNILNWRSLVYKSDHPVSIEQPRCLAKDNL